MTDTNTNKTKRMYYSAYRAARMAYSDIRNLHIKADLFTAAWGGTYAVFGASNDERFTVALRATATAEMSRSFRLSVPPVQYSRHWTVSPELRERRAILRSR